jgi:hypothetical protein
MFVFLTHLVNCCLSNLLSDEPLPSSIPVCFEMRIDMVNTRGVGGVL